MIFTCTLYLSPELTAYGRPVTNKAHCYQRQTNRTSILRSPSLHTSATSNPPPPLPPRPASDVVLLRPHSQSEASFGLRRSGGRDREKQLENAVGGEEGWERGERRGKGAESLYQGLMEKEREGDGEACSGDNRTQEQVLEKQTGSPELEGGRRDEARDSEEMKRQSSSPVRESDMIIHVFDDQRKSKTKHTYAYTKKHFNTHFQKAFARCSIVIPTTEGGGGGGVGIKYPKIFYPPPPPINIHCQGLVWFPYFNFPFFDRKAFARCSIVIPTTWGEGGGDKIS